MKYLPLLWANLWRKKTRTIFTLLSVAWRSSCTASSAPSTTHSRTRAGVTGVDKLITTNKFSLTLLLPFSDIQQIAAVPGVAVVTWITWFGAYYQESKNFVFALPIDTDTYFDLHKNEFVVSDADMTAFRNTRSGALVNSALMKKFGWQVGHKLPLHSTIWTQKSDGSLNWTFDIVGTFDAKDPTQTSQKSSTMLFHYELFDEGRSFGKGQVGWFEERVVDPSQSAQISQKIDALFANSPNETKTQPAKDFAISFVKQLGDVGFVLRAILGAVFFTLLVPHRQYHDAVGARAHARACGAEDLGIQRCQGARPRDRRSRCCSACSPPSSASRRAMRLIPVVRSVLQGIDLSHGVQPPGLGVAVLLALLVGTPPALRAMRLNVVDALMEKR